MDAWERHPGVCWYPEIGVIEGIQEFRLESEFEPLRDRRVLGRRNVKIGEVRPVEPRSPAERSWSCIGLERSILQVFGVNDVHMRRSWNRVHAHRALKLRQRNPIQQDSAVAIVVKGVIPAKNPEGSPAMVGEYGSSRPPSNDSVNCASPVQEWFSFSEREVVSPIDVNGMPYVIKCRAVALAKVPDGELIDDSLPLVGRRGPKGVAPRIIGIKLQTVPLPLAEVYLEALVVRPPCRLHVSLSEAAANADLGAGLKGVCLEEVNGISGARVIGREICIRYARNEGGAHEVAEIVGIPASGGEYGGESR